MAPSKPLDFCLWGSSLSRFEHLFELRASWIYGSDGLFGSNVRTTKKLQSLCERGPSVWVRAA